MKLLSIVIPVYQNALNLSDTIAKLNALIDRLSTVRTEVILVDDGSSDSSLSLLLDANSKNPERFRVIKLSKNFGQTPATQAGLRFAAGDCVAIISADLQEPHDKIEEMVEQWHKGHRFVIAERTDREESRFHQWRSGIYWKLICKFIAPDYPPLGYDFCLIDRQIVNELNRINEKNSSIFVLIYWLGFKPLRLPIVRRVRKAGKSQWTFSKKVMLTLDTLVGFTYVPVRFISLAAIIMALAALVYLIHIFCLWYFWGVVIQGWFSLAGLISLFSAMILFALGVIGEYLWRILDEVRRRPPYVVEDVWLGSRGTNENPE